MRVTIVIQARLTGRRLPGKVGLVIGNKRLIDWVLDYCSASVADSVVLAVPNCQVGRFRELLKDRKNIDLFGGSEENVANRFIEAGKKARADYLVRITCDDPFKPVGLLDTIVQLCRLNVYDYISNNISLVFPEGYDVEAFKIQALIDSVVSDSSQHNLEHVTPNLRENKKYKKLWFESNVSYKDIRCTIDVEKDIDVASKIIGLQNDCSFEFLIDFFNKNSSVLAEYLKYNRSEYYKKNNG